MRITITMPMLLTGFLNTTPSLAEYIPPNGDPLPTDKTTPLLQKPCADFAADDTGSGACTGGVSLTAEIPDTGLILTWNNFASQKKFTATNPRRFGPGWWLNVDRTIAEFSIYLAEGADPNIIRPTMRRYNGDHTSTAFYNLGGTYGSPFVGDTQSIIIRTKDGYRETFYDQTVYTYSRGGLTEIDSPSAGKTKLTWDNRILKSLSYPHNRIVNLIYNTDGRVKQVDHRNGTSIVTTISFSYVNGLLASINGGKKYGNMVFTYDENGLITKVKFFDGSTEEYKYNAKGWFAGSSNSSGEVTTVSYSKNSVTVSSSSSLHPVVEVFDTQGRLVKTVQGVAETEYTYDEKSRPIKISNNFGSVMSYTYRDDIPWAVPTTVTYPDSSQVKYTHKDKLYPSHPVTITYTSASGVSKTESYTYNSDGLVTSYTRDNISKSYVRDNRGRILEVQDAIFGRQAKYVYDTFGRVIEETDNAGLVTYYQYTGAHLTSITDYLGRSTTYEFDAVGQLVRTKRPDNMERLVTYIDGRPSEVKVGKAGTGVYVKADYKYEFDADSGRLNRHSVTQSVAGSAVSGVDYGFGHPHLINQPDVIKVLDNHNWLEVVNESTSGKFNPLQHDLAVPNFDQQ